MLDGMKGSDLRRTIPIVGYIGANGSGKSMLAVQDCLQSLDAGRPVLSSARLIDPDVDEPCDDDACTFALHPDHPKAHPLWRPLTSWQDVIDAEGCDVLLDEVTGIASSRESRALPQEVADKLMQLRRADVCLRWTAPSWARADVLMREVTQAAVLCTGLRRRPVEGNRSWRASTIIWSRIVDARDLDELTQAQRIGTARQPLSVLGRSLQLVSRTDARHAYKTMDSVSAISSAWTGSCLACGGRRAQPRCECGDSGALGRQPSAGTPRPLRAVGSDHSC